MNEKIKEKYLKQFDMLIQKGKEVLAARQTTRFNQLIVCQTVFIPWKTQATNFLQQVILPKSIYYKKIIDFPSYKNYHSSAMEIQGTLIGCKADFESGFLDDLEKQVESSISVDYLDQAENLLMDSSNKTFSHIPAAVLCGAVLEKALRKLCEEQNPPISTIKDNGEPKSMSPLIDDLKKAQVINEIRTKQLRGYADIRNAAAHGRDTEFTKEQVKEMISGVTAFLAETMN